MATDLTPAEASALGDAFTGRILNDEFDAKNDAGTYTHTKYQWSATYAAEIAHEVMMLVLNTDAPTLRNNTGAQIDKGTLLTYPTWDSTNDVAEMVKADANAANKPALWVTTADVADNATDIVRRRAVVTGLNTSAFTEGDELYTSETAGQYTGTAPTASTSIRQVVGLVKVDNASTGEIKFDIHAPDVLGSDNLQASAVSTAKIANDAVTLAKLDMDPTPVTETATTHAAARTNTTIICDCTSNAITVNLPAVSGNSGLIFNIKKIDAGANTVTVDGSGAETIDGAATQTISSQYDSLTVICDGTEWWII